MRLIDTHAHTYLDKFADDRHEVVQRAREAGVVSVIMPNIDRNTMADMEGLEEAYPDFYHACVGLHPCSVPADSRGDALEFVERALERRPWAAVGEIGIDLYWDKSTREEQIKAYRRQLRWARELGIPALIHSRESLELTIGIAEEEQDGNLVPVFHCFTGNARQASRIEEMGGYMGMGGILTYKNSGLKEEITQFSLDRLLMETDSPYLAPAPKRGKRNEPSFLLHTVKSLSDQLGEEVEKVADITTANAEEVFDKYLIYKE